MRRERDLARLVAESPFDLAIIGGGAAGAAALRAAALGGLRAALCERTDFAAGTTSRSTRLVHGGLRYLEHGHLRLVAEALHERQVLRAIAPHLVEPLELHLPLFRHARRGRRRVQLGLWLYDRLAGQARLGTSGLLEPARAGSRLAGLERRDLEAVAVLWDARLRLPARLVIETLLDAEQAGAVAVNRVAVRGVQAAAHGFRLALRDEATAQDLVLEARAVLNAAGPWAGALDRAAGARRPARVQWSRGSHLLFAPFAGAPEQALMVEARRDGRPLFLLPGDDAILAGTTEEPHAVDPGLARATPGEVEYLRAEFAAVWPAAAGVAPFASYAGVRALPRGRQAAAADRRHRLLAQRPRGLFTLVGGKLTTHRLAGEEAARAVAAFLGRRFPAEQRSAHHQLPGARGAAAPPPGASRLERLYGSRAAALLAAARAEPPIPGAGGLLPAEIRFALEEEGAAGLDDILLRRSGVAYAPVLERAGVEAAARVWADCRQAPGSPAAGRAANLEAGRVCVLLEEFYGRQFE